MLSAAVFLPTYPRRPLRATPKTHPHRHRQATPAPTTRGRTQAPATRWWRLFTFEIFGLVGISVLCERQLVILAIIILAVIMASAEDIHRYIDEAARAAAHRTGQEILEQVKAVAEKAATEVAEKVCNALREEINDIKRKQETMSSAASSSTSSLFGGFSPVPGVAKRTMWSQFEHGSFDIKGFIHDWKMLMLPH